MAKAWRGGYAVEVLGELYGIAVLTLTLIGRVYSILFLDAVVVLVNRVCMAGRADAWRGSCESLSVLLHSIGHIEAYGAT